MAGRAIEFVKHATGGWLFAIIGIILTLVAGGGFVIGRATRQPSTNGPLPSIAQGQYRGGQPAWKAGVLAGAQASTECISAYGVTDTYQGPFSCAVAEADGWKGFFPIFYAGHVATSLTDSPSTAQIRSAAIATCLKEAAYDSIAETYVVYPNAPNWVGAGRSVACLTGDDIDVGTSNIGAGNCIDFDPGSGAFTVWNKGDPCTARVVSALTTYAVSTTADTDTALQDEQSQCQSIGGGRVVDDVIPETQSDGTAQQVLHALCLTLTPQ
jgi:hypothetical protein